MIKYLLKYGNLFCGYSNNPIGNSITYDFATSNVKLVDYEKNPSFYDLIDGQLVINDSRVLAQQLIENEMELKKLKNKREALFKKYVDRSPMFYEKLNNEQKQELQVWYNIWCDMPTSYTHGEWIEPPIPEWLEVTKWKILIKLEKNEALITNKDTILNLAKIEW